MPTSRWYQIIMLAALLVASLPTPSHAATGDGFADDTFRALWSRTDQFVAAGGGGHSWIWGANPGERRYERFTSAPNQARLVQYFDKARMEITNPAADRNSQWFVTNGLLVVELITGRLQVGPNDFIPTTPASIPLAGDINNDAAPTYARLAPLTTVNGSNRAPERLQSRISTVLGADGLLSERPDLGSVPTTIVRYEQATGHNVPRIFHDFMQASGPVIEAGRTRTGQLVDPLFAFGYPITEPYWTIVKVGGVSQPVLLQAFERRVLTYTPANPDPWKVEMGNVGQHYTRWRYGRDLRYAQPPFAGGIATRETTITLPTYDYSPAEIPTAAGDPIYPYPRLDWSRVGPPRPRTYRLIEIENRFLKLTFLPELGGRLYQAIDKTTGQNIFYQNSVIKPSPFGQRGWWLGVGGVEWAAPTEEHGYLENIPWDMSITRPTDAINVRASTTERQTGMTVAGTVVLRADEGRFAVTMEVSNPTPNAHPLQMWTNATVVPGGTNRIGRGLHFVVPSEQLIVHATQDTNLPGPRSLIDWPQRGNRDLSRPSNWNGYLGAFAPNPVPFFGAYDTEINAGAVVIQGAGSIGTKIFGLSTNFQTSLYTDDGSTYTELWSGAQPTFWDYPTLNPGARRSINTQWQPLWGLGDLATATNEGALGSQTRPDGGRTITLATTRIMRGSVIISVAGRELLRTPALDLRPDQPLAIDLPPNTPGRIRAEAPGLILEAP